MSTCVTIRTEKEVSPLSIRQGIAKLHPEIQIPDCGSRVSHFYVPEKSIRAVELSKVENGFEVRILVNSSRYDWKIFRDLIYQLVLLSGGSAYEEDDNDSCITDVYYTFRDEVVNERIAQDYSCTKALSKDHFSAIDCVNRQICIGERLYELAGIDDSMPEDQAADLLEKYLLSVQWNRPGHISTRTPECFAKVQGEDFQEYRISCYIYSDGNPDPYDYIYNEPFFSICDSDNETVVLIEYKYLHKIVPDSWTLFDQEQYDCKPLTREEFDAFMSKAKEYSFSDRISCAGENMRHIHVFSKNATVAVSDTDESCVIIQGNTRFLLPKFMELQLIYLLYRKEDRKAAAKLLSSVYKSKIDVDDALMQFIESHPQESSSQEFCLSDLEPLANKEKGLELITNGKTVTISAGDEIELLKLIKSGNADRLPGWFKHFLIHNGYDYTPSVIQKHSNNLASCYLNYQSLCFDDRGILFAHRKMSCSERFVLVLILAFLLFALIGVFL